MPVRYALRGDVSRELLSYGGRVLVHHDPAELAYLITGATPVVLPAGFADAEVMPISAHPELCTVRFPLNREDFR